MDTVNERIKELRIFLKLTQVNFSRQISISQGLIGEIETGYWTGTFNRDI